MTGAEVSSWVQAVILFLTLIATIWISIANYRKASAAEKRASTESDVIANGLDNIAQALKGLESLGSDRSLGVRWHIQWETGDAYSIENVGDERASQVQISAHESLYMKDIPEKPIEKLDPTEGVQFFAVRTMGTVDANISIRWVGADGEAHSWLRALPFKR